jgi:hypothetical protein
VPFTPVNPICAVSDVKAALGITDTTDDDRIGLAVDAASRLIESELGRRYWVDSVASTRYFVAETPFLVDVDDFTDTADLVVQTMPFGVSDPSNWVTWTTADYQLEPINQLEDEQAWPYTQIRAVRSLLFPTYGGVAYSQPYTQAQVAVTTKWGSGSIPTPVQKAGILVSEWLFKSDDAPLGATAFGETGIMRLKDSMPPTAVALLRPYSRDEIFIL